MTFCSIERVVMILIEDLTVVSQREIAPRIFEMVLKGEMVADMQLGHNPNFKFTVGRAIYKGILQFINSQHGKDYVVQPLPVSNFAIHFGKRKTHWNLPGKGKTIRWNRQPVHGNIWYIHASDTEDSTTELWSANPITVSK